MRSTERSLSIYADRLISATELNRQPGRVLDIAASQPVTITRNDDYFALLRREQATDLFALASRTRLAMAICRACETLRRGERLEPGHPVAWVADFPDAADWSELMVDVMQSVEKALDGLASWSDFDALVHEWEESAAVIRHGLLAAAMQEPADPVPLRTPKR